MKNQIKQNTSMNSQGSGEPETASSILSAQSIDVDEDSAKILELKPGWIRQYGVYEHMP